MNNLRRGILTAALGAGTAASLGLAAWPCTAEARVSNPPSPPDSQQDTLKLVQVVFRHGARTPLSNNYWPALVDNWDVCGQLYDPVPVNIINEADGKPRPVNAHDKKQRETILGKGPYRCSKGELTREGQHQARAFGRWLRQRYVETLGFLPEDYSEEVLYGRTTNYSRTIATIRGVLTGLFPGTKGPIKIRTTEEMDEILFGHPESCQRLKTLIKKTASEANDELPSPEIKALHDRIRDILGLTPQTPVKFLDLHDAMTTMQTHGKPIPEEMRNPELLKAIEEQATLRFMRFIVGEAPEHGKPPEILRLGMGRLMHLLVQRMKENNRQPKPEKMYLYSGHDSTVMPLLAALGQEVDHWPVYLSNLVFELWEKPNGEHYVQVLYNREPLSMEKTCGAKACSLKTLRHQVLGPYMLTHTEKQSECLMHFSHDLPAGENVKEVQVGSSVNE